jgi:hypothetical protein
MVAMVIIRHSLSSAIISAFKLRPIPYSLDAFRQRYILFSPKFASVQTPAGEVRVKFQ